MITFTSIPPEIREILGFGTVTVADFENLVNQTGSPIDFDTYFNNGITSVSYINLSIDMTGSIAGHFQEGQGPDYTQNFIDWHKKFIEFIVERGAVTLPVITQYTFNTSEIKTLNRAVTVKNPSNFENTNIIKLNKENYRPQGTTNLYDIIVQQVRDMVLDTNFFNKTYPTGDNKYKEIKKNIFCLTDGQDCESTHTKAQVKKLVEYFSDNFTIEFHLFGVGTESDGIENFATDIGVPEENVHTEKVINFESLKNIAEIMSRLSLNQTPRTKMDR